MSEASATPTKAYAYRSLQPGDPWTLIYAEPIKRDDGQPIGVGEVISKWFATNEPGRLFRVIAVHGSTYETEYIGFEQIGGDQ